jgi:DNA-directed RNA polymerase specialized sigma24 family protein
VRKAERSREVVLRLVPAAEARPKLDEIYRWYCRYVAAVILRLDGRPSELDDLVQDVFVEAAAGIARLREPGAIKGWLATIAVRTVRRRLRMRRAWRFLGLERDAGEVVLVIAVCGSPRTDDDQASARWSMPAAKAAGCGIR